MRFERRLPAMDRVARFEAYRGLDREGPLDHAARFDRNQIEAERFEKIHEDTYRKYGFDLISIEPGSVIERAFAIKTAVCLEPRDPLVRR